VTHRTNSASRRVPAAAADYNSAGAASSVSM
jgi:hypothetical protein